MKKKLIFLFAGMALLSACYYDNFEELYPLADYNNQCDTTSVITYSNHVSGILNNYCNSCHNTSTASGNVILDTYTGVKTVADNGKLMGALKQQTGYVPMPPGTQLTACSIREIEMWVQAGAPNN